MKIHALVLCAVLALGPGAVSSAQQAGGAALGNAAADETALVIGDQGEAAGNDGAAAAAPDTLVYFLRMLLVLAMVLGVMYLLFRVLRGIARPRQAEDAVIRVLSSASLGSGRSLHVVSLGDRAWLLGATDASIGLIAPVEDRDLVDGLLLKASQEGAAPRADFQHLLADLLGAKGKAGARQGGKGLPGGYISRQRDRLRKFREPGE